DDMFKITAKPTRPFQRREPLSDAEWREIIEARIKHRITAREQAETARVLQEKADQLDQQQEELDKKVQQLRELIAQQKEFERHQAATSGLKQE
ncbi:hypothetical protein HDU80_009955, partial [Chytriomyces hyalinus]